MSDVAPGLEFGGCRIEELIARGGMGVVYRGVDLWLGRPVAIKLIASDHAADADVRRRFEREARMMAAVDHPNVVPLYAAGEQAGHLYLVMRYVAGTDLRRLLLERGHLPPDEAVAIVDQVGKALDAAHAYGLVHRDIKPANVLLDGDHAYLADFGITRAIGSQLGLTDSNERVGTVDFMSPEHLRGEDTDARSDVYSLGCLLYTCLAGSPPFHQDTHAATILAHIEDRPPAVSGPGVPRAFDSVIARALAKDPDDRYESAGELGRASAAAAEGRLSPRRVGPPGERRGPVHRPPPAGAPMRGETRTVVLAPTASASPRERVPPPGEPVAPPGEPAPPPREPESTPGEAGGATEPDEARTRVQHERVSSAAAEPVGRPAIGTLLRRSLQAAGIVLVVAVITAAAVGLTRASSPDGPLSRVDVSGAIHAFAAAYGARSEDSLGKVLAPGVERVAPGAVERGRTAVLAEYERQFRADAIRAYVLSGVRLSTGWVGRASARYTVSLAGGTSFSGTVVFGVERVAGRIAIALIATRPSA